MTIHFTPKNLARIRGVRRADTPTNRVSFCGVVPWFDLDNLMGPSSADASSFEGIIEFESLLEHDFLVMARSDGRTWKVIPQPRAVEWWDPRSTQWRVHIPDFEVMRRDRSDPVYVQVKPGSKADKMAEELELIGEAFREQGLAFELWTDREIRRQPRFSNAGLLCGQSGPSEDVEALDRVRDVLRAASPSILRVWEIREAAGIGSRTLQAVLRLHVRREVALDLEQPIDARSLVPLVPSS